MFCALKMLNSKGDTNYPIPFWSLSGRSFQDTFSPLCCSKIAWLNGETALSSRKLALITLQFQLYCFSRFVIGVTSLKETLPQGRADLYCNLSNASENLSVAIHWNQNISGENRVWFSFLSFPMAAWGAVMAEQYLLALQVPLLGLAEVAPPWQVKGLHPFAFWGDRGVF